MTGHHLSVAFFLAIRSIQRGNRFTFLLTVAIMGLVFVNLVFLPSIISGVVVNFNSQSIDYNYGTWSSNHGRIVCTLLVFQKLSRK
jgi:hypothetical protein